MKLVPSNARSKTVGLLLAGLLTTGFAMSASATDTAATATGKADASKVVPSTNAPTPSTAPVHDCDKTHHGKRAEMRQAFQDAKAACKDAPTDQRQQCIHDKMPRPDCSTAPDKAKCEQRTQAMENAYQQCKGESGAAFHDCMKQHRPKHEGKKPNSATTNQ